MISLHLDSRPQVWGVSLSGATSGCLATVSRYYCMSSRLETASVSESRHTAGGGGLSLLSAKVFSPLPHLQLQMLQCGNSAAMTWPPHQLHKEEGHVPERWGMLFLLCNWTISTLSQKIGLFVQNVWMCLTFLLNQTPEVHDIYFKLFEVLRFKDTQWKVPVCGGAPACRKLRCIDVETVTNPGED